MNYIQLLWKDIGNIADYKAITKTQLENLGYKFSKTFINVYKDRSIRKPSFVLYEVCDEDNGRPVSFTYLMYVERKTGLILKKPFGHYNDMVSRADNEVTKK